MRQMMIGSESAMELEMPGQVAAPTTSRRLVPLIATVVVAVLLWEGAKMVLALPDYKLPHLFDIMREFFAENSQGELKLVALGRDAGVTLGEALVGFVIGGLAGFLLAVIFTHSRLIERGLLPYVIASQTVPILAIAPMVVVWLGTSWVSKAVIASYLTFFPVTINALRGLTSIDVDSLALMRSYAASTQQIFFKLRLPSALPYIFTALKISATASVIGAIIGELPVGSTQGIGVNIVYGAQYNTFQPAFLWATITVAALVGIVFYVLVTIVEHRVVIWHVSGQE